MEELYDDKWVTGLKDLLMGLKQKRSLIEAI